MHTVMTVGGVNKVSRQITIQVLLYMLEMTKGINDIRSRVFIVPGTFSSG